MFGKKSVDRTYIENLIAGSVPEGQELDYKKKLPEQSDRGRDELLKDVCAFANAAGGIILFGIEESGPTKAPKLSLISYVEEPYDSAQLRIHQQIDRLVEPRLSGISFDRIDFDGGYVMALQIPGGFGGPYWSGSDGRKQFKVRRGARVSDFTYQELRAAFDRSAAATTRARDWIRERNDQIKVGRTWRPLTRGPIAVVHIVPLVSYHQELTPIDLNQARRLAVKMPLPWQTGFNHDINFDGLILYPGVVAGEQGRDELRGYIQIFRDGSTETVMRLSSTQNPNPQNKLIHPPSIVWTVKDTILKAPAVVNQLGKAGPMMIGVSVLEVTGFGLPDGSLYPTSQMADRDDLVVPTAYLESAESEVDRKRAAKMALDMIWQGFSYGSCPFNDDDGNEE